MLDDAVLELSRLSLSDLETLFVDEEEMVDLENDACVNWSDVEDGNDTGPFSTRNGSKVEDFWPMLLRSTSIEPHGKSGPRLLDWAGPLGSLCFVSMLTGQDVSTADFDKYWPIGPPLHGALSPVSAFYLGDSVSPIRPIQSACSYGMLFDPVASAACDVAWNPKLPMMNL